MKHEKQPFKPSRKLEAVLQQLESVLVFEKKYESESSGKESQIKS